jgi:mRNA-degrading endonuclease RelE of RelBE toxin-antitoxin system
MSRPPKFALIFAPQVADHLQAIDRKHHGLIRQTIDEQLRFTPLRSTRNRKPLDEPAPFGATWELRFGPQNRFRVFYDVDVTGRAIHVLAVGVKDRNRLLIGREEFEL